MSEPVDASVAHGDVRIATTDFGGEGPSLVLLHGLGLTRRSLTRLASSLEGWRVITVDLRGHGASTTAPWDFDRAIGDLDAVVSHFRLDSPFLVGHSLGGMVALRYALAGRPTNGVVNVDGWGLGIAERYLGEDPSEVETYLQRVAGGHLPGGPGALVTHRTRQWREGTTRQVLYALHRADVVAWHRAAACPSLAVFATRSTGRAERWLIGAEAARRQDAHRRGLRRDLAALAVERPDAHVVEVDAGHALVRTHPDVVAAAINRFRTAALASAGTACPHGRVTPALPARTR